jgi:BlaI family transcriptional regulator, penicillinase repressor
MLKKQHKGYLHLSRRERQILDLLYRQGRATVAEVRDGLPDPPGYSAVRAQLRILEGKGAVEHEEVGLQYVYRPAVPRDQAKVSALGHLIRTFFDGSAEAAVAALVTGHEFSRDELDRMGRLIAKAKKEPR